jgi:thiol-disulfide isomerase/thioredoxin
MPSLRGVAISVCIAALLAAPARGAVDALALVDLEGRPFALAPTPDRALVIHFWATWCPSCKGELGDLDAAVRSCGDVDVVAVNVAEDAEQVAAWLADRPLAMRVLIDPSGKAWRASGGREMPANLIWSGAQQRWTFGPSSVAQWRERLAALGCKVATARAESRGYLE